MFDSTRRSFAAGFLSARGVFWCVEQPLNSLLYWVPAVRSTFEIARARRVCTFLGAFGSPTAKCIELMTTVPIGDFAAIKRSIKCFRQRNGGARKQLVSYVPKLKRKGAKGWKAGVWVNGSHKKLKSSERYPTEFCEVLAALAAKLYFSTLC